MGRGDIEGEDAGVEAGAGALAILGVGAGEAESCCINVIA